MCAYCVGMKNSNRLNDRDRELWVLNDWDLYRWYLCSGLAMRAFIRRNRGALDAAIRRAGGGQ